MRAVASRLERPFWAKRVQHLGLSCETQRQFPKGPRRQDLGNLVPGLACLQLREQGAARDDQVGRISTNRHEICNMKWVIKHL